MAKGKKFYCPPPQINDYYTTIPHKGRRIVKITYKPQYLVIGLDGKHPVSGHQTLKEARQALESGAADE